jgi:hypothetical protein
MIQVSGRRARLGEIQLLCDCVIVAIGTALEMTGADGEIVLPSWRGG